MNSGSGIDIGPVAYVIGIITVAIGGSMVVPMSVDFFFGNPNWQAFAISAYVTMLTGISMALSTKRGVGKSLTIKQVFLLTTGIYLVLPCFGAIPLMVGEPGIGFIDAFFETMSGLTTTGATVISGLETLPPGVLLWRGMLQWFGGIGVIVIAVVFLPFLQVGGMQLFRWESLDTLGTILPRAVDVTRSISFIYIVLSIACALGYSFAGLSPFDSIVHAMTTVATGGFANYDDSFSSFGPRAEYVGALFMILAALPFVRYFQFVRGSFRPLVADSQIHAFLGVVVSIVVLLCGWQLLAEDWGIELAVRKAMFNGVSILTGTGYASADYGSWGSFPIVAFFLIGLIGGCAGSTSCSIKIFRFQLMLSAMSSHITRVRLPHAIIAPRLYGIWVPQDVLTSVMAFFVFFLATLAGTSLLLTMMGLDFVTSVSGAAAALANIGPGLGDTIGPAGNYSSLGDGAKLLLAFVMLIGRLELTAVYAMFTFRFWRG